ncbi:hypothetical protein ACG3SL_02940 [Sphingomonas sp. CJ20]
MNLPIASVGALALGVLAALGIAMLPGTALESLVSDSGLPSVLPAAEPPLGMTARLAVMLGTGVLAGAFSWLTLFVLFGMRSITLAKAAPAPDPHFADMPTPTIRRADAHPDAPPRAPLMATRDLGTPFLDVRAQEPEAGSADLLMKFRPVEDVAAEASPVPEAPQPLPLAPMAEPIERPLPLDLGTPMAALDPDSIPAVPMTPPLSLKPLRRAPPAEDKPVYARGERIETFELPPAPARPAPPPSLRPRPRGEEIARPQTEASVHALLERLERGAMRRGLATGIEKRAPAPQPPVRTQPGERGLEEALVTLRNLARRA